MLCIDFTPSNEGEISLGIRDWARKRSPWVIHFNAGSCNGCDIELTASFAPKYDLERFGILRKGSPRHSDILVVTGPVTRCNHCAALVSDSFSTQKAQSICSGPFVCPAHAARTIERLCEVIVQNLGEMW